MSINKDLFIIEQITHEDRYYRPYDYYTPNFKKRALTTKFYSKNEEDLEHADKELVNKIKMIVDSGPKARLEWPESQNQWYGWFTNPFLEAMPEENPFFFGRHHHNFVKHQAVIKNDITMRCDKFTGVPFKLK